MTNRGKMWLYKLYSFLAYAIPMATLFFINRKEYASGGNMFGFFGFVILFFVILSFKNAFLRMIRNKTLLTVSAIVLIFSVLMQYLADNMILISTVSLVAASIQSIIEVVADTYEVHSWVIVNGVKKRNPDKAITDAQAWREAYGFGGTP